MQALMLIGDRLQASCGAAEEKCLQPLVNALVSMQLQHPGSPDSSSPKLDHTPPNATKSQLYHQRWACCRYPSLCQGA